MFPKKCLLHAACVRTRDYVFMAIVARLKSIRSCKTSTGLTKRMNGLVVQEFGEHCSHHITS